MPEELKLCPFCGGTNFDAFAEPEPPENGQVRCRRCDATIHREDLAAAVEAWNCRISGASSTSVAQPEADSLNAPQPAPRAGIGPAIWDLVIEDMHERDAGGLKKYGRRLRAGAGRDHLIDAYQEALDLAVYLRQEIEERRISSGSPSVAETTKGELQYELDLAKRLLEGDEDCQCLIHRLARNFVTVALRASGSTPETAKDKEIEELRKRLESINKESQKQLGGSMNTIVRLTILDANPYKKCGHWITEECTCDEK